MISTLSTQTMNSHQPTPLEHISSLVPWRVGNTTNAQQHSPTSVSAAAASQPPPLISTRLPSTSHHVHKLTSLVTNVQNERVQRPTVSVHACAHILLSHCSGTVHARKRSWTLWKQNATMNCDGRQSDERNVRSDSARSDDKRRCK